MHQNLRSTLILSDESIEDYQTIENFEERQQKKQMLIPAMQYGTFFTIYAKFLGHIKDKKFLPTHCDVFLQNYQGLVTVGLTKIQKTIDIVFDPEVNAPVYLLKINLKGLHAKPNFNQPQEIEISSNPLLSNYTETSDADWDSLKKGNNEIDSKYLLRVLVTYDNLDSDVFDEKNPVNDSKLIDSFAYERDGDDLLVKEFSVYNGNGKMEPMAHLRGSYKIFKDEGKIVTYACRPSYVQFKME